MKLKIKEALKQGYLNLGLTDEALERVATSVETLISDESDIDKFVKSELVKSLMRFEQSDADRKRTAQKKQSEGEPKSEQANNPEPKPEATPQPQQPQDMAKIIADAVAAAIKPISDEFASFKKEQFAKNAISSAEATFKGNDYVKKYTDEAADAWERATEMYEATGKSWTAEELQTRAMGYFNKAVSKKGVDTTKPFQSDGGGNDSFDASGWEKAQKALGWESPKE